MSRNVIHIKHIFLILLWISTVKSSGQVEHSYAEKHFNVTHLGRNINTKYSESGASIIDDTLLLFSSMQEIEDQGNFLEQQPVLMQLFQVPIGTNGVPSSKSTIFSTQINSSSYHTYNATYDKRIPCRCGRKRPGRTRPDAHPARHPRGPGR